MEKTIVNKPPVNTFGWLGVNGTEIDAPQAQEYMSFALGAGEKRTVVVEASAVKLTAVLESGAVLQLVQVSRSESESRVKDISVRCAENARFEWYRVVLGGTATYDNCTATLEGPGSSFAAEIGYRLGGDEKYDMNLEVIHLGEKTKSDIHAAGVLRDRANKLFRGTIDLRRGCSGSEGNEIEDVLLMDETVGNVTVPVILCGEEDVVGNHGATIGRLDEELVYYMCSRGLSREQVYDRMAQARIDAVIAKIPDENTRRELMETDEEETI